MISLALLLIPIVTIACLYQLFTLGLSRFFFVPSQDWQDKINQVIGNETPAFLKVGPKRSSYRRRLITASAQPSFYSNFSHNKLRILPLDRANIDGRFLARMRARAPQDPQRKVIFGFFHPYANNGGGGEKVLWQAVLATLMENERNIVAVYTTNADAEPAQILEKTEAKFKIGNLDSTRLVFVYLRRFSAYIDCSYWTHFTLAGQLLGSVFLALEAMYELSPDVWIDTMGLPGSYWPVALILKVPIVAYVHYPVIQPDMFRKLKFKKARDVRLFAFTPSDSKQLFKFAYWSFLYYIYVYLGSYVDVTLTNGTWTFDHISSIWSLNRNKTVEVVYPPCSTEDMIVETPNGIPRQRENKLLYIAQFRPEKRHALVLDNYRQFIDAFRASKTRVLHMPTLVFLGSCRTATDSSTLDYLRQRVTDLKISEFVEFIVDCSFDEVKHTLSACTFGLNAMWNEHFGIGVVEYLCAGVVPIVHASAGPLLDIVRDMQPATAWKNEVGFFFKSESDPDFEGVENDGLLEFTVSGKMSVFPALNDLLVRLFIDEPENSSESALAGKRELGIRLLQERFSNKRFLETWTDHVRKISELEIQYRDTRRDKVDEVY